MLRRNISVMDELVNGSMDTVKKFRCPALRRDLIDCGDLSDSVLIQFDDPKIGEKVKEKNGSVTIIPVTVTFQGSRGYGATERRMPVSYTHLDVYKRQVVYLCL